MALKIQVVADFETPGLRETWAALSAASPQASVFSTYEWCRTWTETVGKTWEPRILVFRGEQDRAAGLVPGGCRRRGLARWFTFLGRDHVSGDHLDLLCAPADHQRCVEAFGGHFSNRTAPIWRRPGSSVSKADGICLGELDTSSPTRAALIAWADRRGLAWMERAPQVLPFVQLPGSWEDYLASLKERMRADVRRSRRNLSAVPGAALRVVREPAEVAGALEHLFRLHRLRWAREGGRGNFQDPAKCDFLRRFCGEAARLGWARACLLEGTGEVHGALLAFHWRGTAYSYQLGWNPAGPFRSPGILLNAESMAQAIREGVQRYDFLRGDEPHKWRWTSQSAEATTLVIGCRLPGQVAVAVQRTEERVKTLCKRALGPRGWQRLKTALTLRADDRNALASGTRMLPTLIGRGRSPSGEAAR